jgi:hypothetical protein
MSEVEEEQKFDVRVVISSLGNERRIITFNGLTKEQCAKLVSDTHSAFDTVRKNSSLLLSGSDGEIVIANLDNVSFVEVHVGGS